jgi:hypothetical protein
VNLPKPRWTSSTFLVYVGGLTVLGAAVGALAYLADAYSSGAYVAWAILVLAVLAAIAHGFRVRGRWAPAGVFAFATVIAFGVFVGALWSWFGWLSTNSESPFEGFHVAQLSLELLTLIAAAVQLRRFRFPLITLLTTSLGWFFVTDLVSGGGSWSAVVTLLVGLSYLVFGGASERPSAFWLNFVAGLLVGGSLLYWWHSSDWNWALVAVAALVYVRIGESVRRSSWTVLGAAGLLAAATHFTIDWTSGRFPFGDEDASIPRVWVPLVVYATVGFLLVALGVLVARLRTVPAGE